ncbi:MAG: DUF1805 domain-containing protein [Candidatus Thermoplasmatota archaeon]|nr:DUF1805 domain-containing protein [Candidatus Thermoplasmatota archaeon]
MKIKKIKLENGQVIGSFIELNNAPLIVLQAKKGYVMCGYLNMNTANKLGDIAGRVSGVKTFEEALDSIIVEASENAKKMSLHEGKKTKEFLNLLM